MQYFKRKQLKIEFKVKYSLEKIKVLIEVVKDIFIFLFLLGKGLTFSEDVEEGLVEIED